MRRVNRFDRKFSKRIVSSRWLYAGKVLQQWRHAMLKIALASALICAGFPSSVLAEEKVCIESVPYQLLCRKPEQVRQVYRLIDSGLDFQEAVSKVNKDARADLRACDSGFDQVGYCEEDLVGHFTADYMIHFIRRIHVLAVYIDDQPVPTDYYLYTVDVTALSSRI